MAMPPISARIHRSFMPVIMGMPACIPDRSP